MVKTIEYLGDVVRIIDQRYLPHKKEFINIRNAEEGALTIETMAIRGAPAIGVCAMFSIFLEARNLYKTNKLNDASFLTVCERLARTRPTAVNLFIAIEHIKKVYEENKSKNNLIDILEKTTIDFYEKDIESCKKMGRFGAELLPNECTVITHCNAGALATAGYGTALGVIRAAHEMGKKIKVYADETRPWLQGARLTAWELMEEKIDVTLISDSTAAYLMSKKKIDAVITGADRITRNGDVANKIGTYSLSVNANFHNVPVYIAAPTTTIDPNMMSGKDIPIEERNENEITYFRGEAVAPIGVRAFNPSFDVTEAKLIKNIITEEGVFDPSLNGITEALKRGGKI